MVGESFTLRVLPKHDDFLHEYIDSIYKLESYIECLREYEKVSDMFDNVSVSLKNIKLGIKKRKGMCIEGILYTYPIAMVILYCKSFTDGKGRVKLNSRKCSETGGNNEPDVFTGKEHLREIHTKLIHLRNNLFAHHSLGIGKFDTWFRIIEGQFRIEIDLIKINTNHDVVLDEMVGWVNFKEYVTHVTTFIKNRIIELKEYIEKSVNNNNHTMEMLSRYCHDGDMKYHPMFYRGFKSTTDLRHHIPEIKKLRKLPPNKKGK